MSNFQDSDKMKKKIELLEDELATLRRCSAIIAIKRGFQETAKAIFDACKDSLGATAGYVAWLSDSGEENEVLFLDSGGMPCSVDPTLPMPMCGLRSEAYRYGKTVFNNHFSKSGWAKYLPGGRGELKNIMFVPMIIEKKVVGLLGLANKPSDFTENDSEIASVFGDFAAIALRQAIAEDERQRFQRSLIESEEKFHKLYSTMNEGVCLHEVIYDEEASPVDYRILDINVTFERIIGLSKNDVIGRDASEIYGTGEPPFLDKYAQVAESGEPLSFETYWAPMDKYFLISAFSPRKGQFGTVFTDITDQKIMEERLRDSEEYLSTTLNSIGDAVITTDELGRIVRMNPIAEKLTGWHFSEAQGRLLKQVFAIYNENTRQKAVNPVTKVLKKGVIVGLANPTVLVSKDGTEYYIDDRAAPIHNEKGTMIGVVLIFRDISEKYKTEAELRRSEARYRTLYDSISDAVVVADTHRKITSCNQAFTQLFGFTLDDIRGESTRCFYQNDEEFRKIGKALTENHAKSSFLLSTKFKKKSGEVFHGEEKLHNFRDAEGHAVGWIGSIRDTTERTIAAEALRESEEKFRLMFNSSPDAITINRLQDGFYVETNEGFKVLSGFSHDDVVGRTSLDLNIWLDPAHRATLVRDLTEKGRCDNLEATFRRKDGSLMTGLTSARVISLNGEPHIISTTRDISERKQAESERELLLKAIEQANEIVVITDATGIIQYVNPAFEEITGYESQEALGKNPRILKSGRHNQSYYENLWKTILSGYPWKGHLINRRKNGAFYTAECSISPIKDNHGDIINFVWISRDITNELELEKRVSQAQRMEAIGALAGGIAHDFNNLLFPIVGMAEMIIEDTPSESLVHENAEEILIAAKRAGDLVNQILSFSRQSDLQKKPIRIQQILKEVIKLARATIPANIEIVHDIQSDCGLVLADSTQVHQITMNLITNAYHAVEKNAGRISISLKEKQIRGDIPPGMQIEPGKYALMSISDTGHGIGQEFMSKIFEPYFTTKPKGKGTGLGLSVVYGIVKEYRGDIQVTSEVGRGTTFDIYLPMMKKETVFPETAVEMVNARGTERILLVDDEASIVRLEKQMLERLGYQVEVRTSSIEALNAFGANPDNFDLVISDMTMPNLTGDELAKALISIKPGIPIIICTGFSEKFDSQQIEALGIKGFLMKPIIKSDMAKMVRNVLDMSKEDEPKPPSD
jgi:PAS domain S-box-containing protein